MGHFLGYSKSEIQTLVAFGTESRKARLTFVKTFPMATQILQLVKKVESRLAAFGYRDFSGKELYAPVSYALKKPGKRIRPALVLLGAKLADADADTFVDLATAAELLHTASLVHDDMVDSDTARRGSPAVHVKYGREAALLAGDALIAKAVAMASKYGQGVMKKVSEASLDMCAGELQDYALQRDGRVPGVREYLRVARLKSGVFMGTCASIAAVYKRNRKKAGALYGFGLSLGVAFQIRDDIIEFANSEERAMNGGGHSPESVNLVNVFARQFKVNKSEAIKRAADLNNYFADRALRFVQEEEKNEELASYVDFVRVTDR